MKFETIAIWEGQEADKTTGATIIPIYQTSTFTQSQVGVHKGYEYSRCSNPTRTALDTCLAALEGANHGLTFSSGLAAEHAVLSLLKPGDHIIAPLDMYGGTYRLLTQIFDPLGIKTSFTDFTDIEKIKDNILPETKLIWIETPTNPLLKIFDIASIAELGHQNKFLVVVDNTFASPFFQKPIQLGADIVVHSTTKYINGHSDVIGGAILLNNTSIYEQLKVIQSTVGAVPSPFDSWLTLRGLKTLSIRMQQHEKNAFEVAKFLLRHPNVEEVFYPGFKSHPGHLLAKKQMTGFGGLVSFKIKGDLDEANLFFKKLQVFQLADSLGGVESLANYSALMTHESFPVELRQKIGVTDNLIRLSVGLEHIDDLIYDLLNSLT